MKEPIGFEIEYARFLMLNVYFDALRDYHLRVSSACDLFPNIENAASRFDFDFTAGCEKLVIIPRGNFPWVIKTGLHPHCTSLKKEADIFTAALEEGVSNYFADTYYFEDSVCPFSMQLKVEINSFRIEQDYECIANANEIDDIELIEQLFGNTRLTNFAMEENIYDLHSGNMGFFNDSLLLVDFAGVD